MVFCLADMLINRTFAFLIVLITGLITAAQTPNDQYRIFRAPREIPEASLPCSPEEDEWWKAVRKAGTALRRSKGGKKELTKFTELLNEAAAKSYKVPVADQRPMSVTAAEPEYSEEGRAHNVNGAVMLSAVVLPDGTLDKIRITKGLGFGLDEKAIEAARKTTFLPGVKNGAFVRTFIQLEMNFNIYRIR
jgi:TonB family protein